MGVCEQQCRRLNEAWFKYVDTQFPFVTLKFAQSLDGRLATATGNSQWISSPSTLRLAHKLRREHDCVMVGIGTVLADDPRLTVRLVNGRNPLRIVVDSHLRTPATAGLLREGAHRTLIATTLQADSKQVFELEALGAEVMTTAGAADGSGVDLKELLRTLGRRGIASVLVEGGAGLITSLLAARLADRLVVVVAPKLIGRGIESIGDLGTTTLDEAITFSSVETRKLGPDVVFDARLK
jgi:riboflavin-specific deaminase-like protein